MRHLTSLALLLALAAPATLAAQAAPASTMDEATATALGQRWVKWIYDSQIDSLYDVMAPAFRDQIGGKEAIVGAINNMMMTQGLETELVKEIVVPAEGGFAYTRVIHTEGAAGQLMAWNFLVAPDGRMLSGGLNQYQGD